MDKLTNGQTLVVNRDWERTYNKRQRQDRDRNRTGQSKVARDQGCKESKKEENVTLVSYYVTNII